MYVNCSIFWRITLQTEIALNIDKAEEIALSFAFCEVLPLVTILEEINKLFPLLIKNPSLFASSMNKTSPALTWLTMTVKRAMSQSYKLRCY